MLADPFLRWADKIYSFFIKIGSNLQSLFLLYMRVTWGHQLLLTGVDKLKDIAGTAQMFKEIGIPSPVFHAYEVGLIEAVGGILLVIGFASRIAALPIIFVMLTALSTVHAEQIGNLKFLIDPYLLVMQEPFPFLFTALLVFIFGPGRVSLDAWLKRWVDHQPKY